MWNKKCISFEIFEIVLKLFKKIFDYILDQIVIWVVSAAETKTYPRYGTLDEFLMVNFDEIVVNGKLVG